MKMKLNLIIILALLYVTAGCNANAENNNAVEQNTDLITDPFQESQAEIQTVLDEIFKAIQDNDADKLISYHIYSPKFTEFRDSERRFNSEENELYERGLVEAVSGFDYNLGDLKINVFGDVAVVTFHADFRPHFGDDVVQIWGSTTLVFVKVDGAWKITHEHHSPLNVG